MSQVDQFPVMCPGCGVVIQIAGDHESFVMDEDSNDRGRIVMRVDDAIVHRCADGYDRVRWRKEKWAVSVGENIEDSSGGQHLVGSRWVPAKWWQFGTRRRPRAD